MVPLFVPGRHPLHSCKAMPEREPASIIGVHPECGEGGWSCGSPLFAVLILGLGNKIDLKRVNMGMDPWFIHWRSYILKGTKAPCHP